MGCGTALHGTLLAAAPLAGRRPRLLALSPPPSTPSIHIQNRIYSMSQLPLLKARGKGRCEASLASNYTKTSEFADLDWENLGFGLVQTDFMYIAKCGPDGNFDKGEMVPFGPIEMNPSSGVLNYGQGLFEGLKAYRKSDGSILLFRPLENAMRMQTGAVRMCMPAPPVEQFVDAVKQTVLANKKWVPPTGKGSLYIRPLLVGSGAVLGLAPAPEYTFIIFASPVGNYFKEGLAPINLIVEDNFHRATPGGTGGVKTIGNYASVEERLVSVDELLDADEVFCTGTAVVVSPVGSITYQGKRIEYAGNQGVGVVSQQLYTSLTSLQMGQVEDSMGWTVQLN